MIRNICPFDLISQTESGDRRHLQAKKAEKPGNELRTPILRERKNLL